MKKLVLVTLTWATIITPAVLTAPAFAASGLEGGSDGTRGGGQVVRHEGQLRLRDLVDTSVCEYKTGNDLREENPALTAELSRLAQTDWYLAASLRNEIDLLEICLTDRLVQLNASDYDSVIHWGRHSSEQAAIRFLDSRDVYLNKRIYDSLPAEDKAYLLIHEAIHSFIPWNTSRRNEKVRSAVASLRRAAQGRSPSRDRLFRDLRKSSVEFPFTSHELAEHRTAIEFALGSAQEKKAFVRSHGNLDALFLASEAVGAVTPKLLSADASLALTDPSAQMANLMEGDRDIMNLVLNTERSRATRFDALLVALSLPGATTDKNLQELILRSRAMKQGPGIFARMKNKRLVLQDGRIRGLDGFHLLGVTEAGANAPALGVRPVSREEIALAPRETSGFARLLGILVNLGDFGKSSVQALLSRDGGFYDAFEVKTLQEQLESLTPPVAREKDYLREALPELVKGIRILFRYEVEAAAGLEAADQIDRMVDWDALTN